MKLYRDAPGATITMRYDVVLDAALRGAIKQHKITHAIETGTFRGTGSTLFVANAMEGVGRPQSFVTIEANFANWLYAKKSLQRFTFVQCLWGWSVPGNAAAQFIRSDPAILDHKAYPEIYIDDVADPARFYLSEIGLGAPVGAGVDWRGEDLLRVHLKATADKCPLIVLDSAGGIGLLEFNYTRETMGSRPYVLLLDDIGHLKHFRSAKQVESDPKFSILARSETCMLAFHAGG